MKKKVTLIVIAVLLTISLVVGVSYAYWRLTYTQTGVNKLISSCFSMELTNEKNNITLDSAYPISDEKGKSLTPYSFTITNTCDLFASYKINLEMLEGTTLSSKYIKTMINNEAITNLNTLESTDTSIDGATESRVLFKGSLGSGDSTDYTLRLWIDSDTPATDDTMNKIFQAKITVTGEVSTYSPVENGFTNLADALLVNEYQTTSLDVAKDRISSKQEVDFTKTAPVIIWKEIEDNEPSVKTVKKVSPTVIGSYGVTSETTKIALATEYKFDTTTGYYSVGDKTYYDPLAVDYSQNTYYFCTSTITAATDGRVSYFDGTKCSLLYEIISLERTEDTTLTLVDGTKIPTISYYFNVRLHEEMELESDKSDKGIYEAIDDYGDSYYYRGNVTNNYVKFAGFYWRVVRINGDGSIRLVYNGTSSSSFEQNNLSVFESRYNQINTNPTYVGYMYSNTLNSSYEDTIRNDNDSNVKRYLDSWYKTNIYDKGYSSHVADSGFCNDRSLASNSEGTGATDSENTSFAPYERFVNSTPQFTCPNPTNDLFTLSNNSIGNKALTYPIGMITIDEAIFSGFSKGYLNKMSYLYANMTSWTMSQAVYQKYPGAAVALVVYDDGQLGTYYVIGNLAVRPVINLRADTEITGGIGTANDPFVVD